MSLLGPGVARGDLSNHERVVLARCCWHSTVVVANGVVFIGRVPPAVVGRPSRGRTCSAARRRTGHGPTGRLCGTSTSPRSQQLPTSALQPCGRGGGRLTGAQPVVRRQIATRQESRDLGDRYYEAVVLIPL